MGTLEALGRSQAVTNTINQMNNQDYNRMNNDIMKNKLIQARQQQSEFNKLRDVENLMADIPSYAQPIYKAELRKSGWVSPDGKIRQGLFGKLQEKMKDPIMQAKIGQAELGAVTQKYQQLKQIQGMRDQKQQKEALSQFGIKPEELGQAVMQIGKQRELTEWKVMPKMKEAQARMQQAQQAKAVQTWKERTFRQTNAVRAQKGLEPLSFIEYNQKLNQKDPTTLAINSALGYINQMGIEGDDAQKVIDKAVGLNFSGGNKVKTQSPIPEIPDITEEKISHTMKKHSMTRDEVIKAVKKSKGIK